MNPAKIIKKQCTTIRGIKVKETDKYNARYVNFGHLLDCVCNQIIAIPKFNNMQIDKNKVNSMIELNNTHREYFNFMTNPLQFARLTNEDGLAQCFLIDGQHRFEMYCESFKTGNITDVIINIVNCVNIDEMKIYYLACHNLEDSVKFSNDFNTVINTIMLNFNYKHFEQLLSKSFKNNFMKSSNDFVYMLEEFIEKLKENNFLNINESIHSALTFLIQTNNYYVSSYYNTFDTSTLTTSELELFQAGIIFTMKNNNFVTSLVNDDIPFVHESLNQIKLKKIKKQLKSQPNTKKIKVTKQKSK